MKTFALYMHINKYKCMTTITIKALLKRTIYNKMIHKGNYFPIDYVQRSIFE